MFVKKSILFLRTLLNAGGGLLSGCIRLVGRKKAGILDNVRLTEAGAVAYLLQSHSAV